jgi:hypothetical protein
METGFVTYLGNFEINSICKEEISSTDIKESYDFLIVKVSQRMPFI